MRRHPVVRWAWILVGSLVTIVGIAFGTFEAVALLAHEEETIVETLDADGLLAVEVENTAGSTRIVGRRELDEVRITARVSDGLIATEHGHRRTDDRLVVEASCPHIENLFCDVDYVIEVPAEVTVVARNDSRTEITGIAGGIDIENDYGHIELERITGDIRIRTDYGRVTGRDMRADVVDVRTDHGDVDLDLASAPSSLWLVTSYGDVDVVLPDDGTAYRLQADSDRGAIDTPIRTDPDAEATITATTEYGDVTVRYPE